MPDASTRVATSVVIHAEGASFERTGTGEILRVENGGDLTLVGGTIRGATGGGTADGVQCAFSTLRLEHVLIADNIDRGLDANVCILEVDRSVFVRNAIAALRIVEGRFRIRNSYFLDNGMGAGGVGALTLNANATPNELVFNTIVRNRAATAAFAGGVNCHGTAIDARNNLIVANDATSETTGTSCAHAYSVIGPAGTPAGPNVVNMTLAQVAFVNAQGTTEADFHITAASMLRGAADPATPATVDYDGDARTSPADIGADEVP